MTINYSKKGATLLEIIVVLAIIVLLLAVVYPGFAKNRENQTLKGAVQDTLSSINKAHTETLASLNSSSYGVHFQSNKIVIFKGTSFSVNDPSNETINIASPSYIADVSLRDGDNSLFRNNGSADIYFIRLSGYPSNANYGNAATGNIWNGAIYIMTANFCSLIKVNGLGNISAFGPISSSSLANCKLSQNLPYNY
jgi:prepilin-type N-terminal cleavage/methylation domain-containing protein